MTTQTPWKISKIIDDNKITDEYGVNAELIFSLECPGCKNKTPYFVCELVSRAYYEEFCSERKELRCLECSGLFALPKDQMASFIDLVYEKEKSKKNMVQVTAEEFELLDL